MLRTFDDYIAKGFEPRYAEYFLNGRRKIISVVPNDDFTLLLTFDNGEQRVYDVRPLLQKNTVFEPFMDIEKFRRVYLDDIHAVSWDIDPTVDSREVWNNKVDLCPDVCYVESVPIK